MPPQPPATAVVLREATPSDIEPMVGLLRLLFSIESDFDFDEARQTAGLRMMLDEPETRVIIVAELAGDMVGMCSAQLVVSTAEGGHAALIEDMVVQEAYRGRGIGEQLLTAVEEWCSRQGASRIQLLADCDNQPALEFYRKRGWERTRLIGLRKRLDQEGSWPETWGE